MKLIHAAVIAAALAVTVATGASASRFHVKHHMRSGMHKLHVKMHHGHMHMHNLIHHGHM